MLKQKLNKHPELWSIFLWWHCSDINTLHSLPLTTHVTFMFWVNTDNWLSLIRDDRSLRHFCFLEPVLSWHIYYRTTVPLASISRCLCVAIIPPCTQRQEVTASLPSGIYSFSTFFIPQTGYFCTFVFNQKIKVTLTWKYLGCFYPHQLTDSSCL